MRKIKTLIVDDSLTIRKILQHLLKADPRFDEAVEAATPAEALKIIATGGIDLITMDLHLPAMHGADLIKEYMPIHAIPTVVISSLRPDDSHLVLESLENGAVDYIEKPSREILMTMKSEILDRLYQASQVRTEALRQKQRPRLSIQNAENMLLLIGASTGGTEAIKVLLSQLGDRIPATLIVQHIPQYFSEAFASRLNRLFSFEVKEAQNGDYIKSNRVLIAPGGRQMKLVKSGSGFIVVIEDTPPVNRHKPSVDYLFHSAANDYPGAKIGVLLTGMGADGADGLLKLRQNAAYTIAQDEASSVVFGMPKEAIKRGAAMEISGLHQMGEAIQNGVKHFSNIAHKD